MKTIDDRILAIEAAAASPNFPLAGTTLSLSRCVNSAKDGVQWCMAVGGLGGPKEFFYGGSIDEVVAVVERELSNIPVGGDLEEFRPVAGT